MCSRWLVLPFGPTRNIHLQNSLEKHLLSLSQASAPGTMAAPAHGSDCPSVGEHERDIIALGNTNWTFWRSLHPCMVQTTSCSYPPGLQWEHKCVHTAPGAKVQQSPRTRVPIPATQPTGHVLIQGQGYSHVADLDGFKVTFNHDV